MTKAKEISLTVGGENVHFSFDLPVETDAQTERRVEEQFDRTLKDVGRNLTGPAEVRFTTQPLLQYINDKNEWPASITGSRLGIIDVQTGSGIHNLEDSTHDIVGLLAALEFARDAFSDRENQGPQILINHIANQVATEAKERSKTLQS